MKQTVPANLAQDILVELPLALKSETVPLEVALGRVLAQDIFANESLPPYNRSPYDGYACRAEDTIHASFDRPAVLTVIDEIQAGETPQLEITKGTAAKISTGAPLPKGADVIVKFEETQFCSQTVKIFREIKLDSNIVFAGEDVEAGKLIAKSGTLITPPVSGLLAGLGMAQICVYKKPIVTILSTGSELLDIRSPIKPAKIRNSSFYLLSGYLHRLGVVPKNGNIVPDVTDKIATEIKTCLRDCDMLITTGGASVGDYDLVEEALEQLGATVLFNKVALKPGGSMLAAVLNQKLVLSLSGNPVAALASLLRIALPYLNKLCGKTDCYAEKIQVLLKTPFPKKSPKMRIIMGRLVVEEAKAYFELNPKQGNAVISSCIDCDLFGEIPAGSPPVPAGTVIDAYRIPGI